MPDRPDQVKAFMCEERGFPVQNPVVQKYILSLESELAQAKAEMDAVVKVSNEHYGPSRLMEDVGNDAAESVRPFRRAILALKDLAYWRERWCNEARLLADQSQKNWARADNAEQALAEEREAHMVTRQSLDSERESRKRAEAERDDAKFQRDRLGANADHWHDEAVKMMAERDQYKKNAEYYEHEYRKITARWHAATPNEWARVRYALMGRFPQMTAWSDPSHDPMFAWLADKALGNVPAEGWVESELGNLIAERDAAVGAISPLRILLEDAKCMIEASGMNGAQDWLVRLSRAEPKPAEGKNEEGA